MDSQFGEEGLAQQIGARMREYYADYYRDRLGLPDWQSRVANRLSEELQANRLVVEVETWFKGILDQKDRVLVMGGGTGGGFTALTKRGYQVYAIEPNERGAAIGGLKAKRLRIPPSRFMCGYGEAIPFVSDSFDFVWCVAVLEHVQDVEGCIREMVRVTKPLGRMFLVTYDYRQFYEPHYKLVMPLFLPKWMLRAYLRLRGRPLEFLDSLQFVNQNLLGNTFQDCPVTAFQILQPWPDKAEMGVRGRLIRWMARALDIQQRQWWVLQKRETP